MVTMRGLESRYLEHSDAQAQSGFAGGRQRWIAERSPLVDAIHRDGSFLDVGCANALLAADVVDWSRARGLEIEPHGIDLGADLIDLARRRLPLHADSFAAADASVYEPRRRWTFVYSLLELSPPDLWCGWLPRLASWVEQGGRLIIGSYGSRSRNTPPVDVEHALRDCGMGVIGSSHGGNPPICRLAWTEPHQPSRYLPTPRPTGSCQKGP